MFANLRDQFATVPDGSRSRAAWFASRLARFAFLVVEGDRLGTEFANRATLFAMPTTIHGLIQLARHTLSVGSQGDFGVLMGSSRRSGQRWETGRATPSYDQLCKMTAMVYPHDPELAAHLAHSVGQSLVSLGIVKPAPPPAPWSSRRPRVPPSRTSSTPSCAPRPTR